MRVLGSVLPLAVVLGFVLGSAGSAHSQEQEPRTARLWSGNHALTLPRGRLEVGLLQSSHYGLTDRVELSLHPLLFFALPHVEAKVSYERSARHALSMRGRLAYPSLFLGLVSREGSGGLLPKTSSPPQALLVEGDVLGTLFWQPQQLVTATVGLAVAPHTAFTPAELPLLDFPFLYPRFAPLYTVLVPRASLGFEGRLTSRLFYELQLLGYLMPALPDAGTAYALEQALALEYRFNDNVAASLGLRASEAAYAYGSRVHFLPYLDVRVGF